MKEYMYTLKKVALYSTSIRNAALLVCLKHGTWMKWRGSSTENFCLFFSSFERNLELQKKLKKYVYMLLFKKEACISVFRHWNTYIFFETFTFFQKNTVNWWFMMAASLFHPFPAVKRENTDEQNIWLLVGSSSSFKMYSFDAYVRGVVVAKHKCTLFLCRLNYNFFS